MSIELQSLENEKKYLNQTIEYLKKKIKNLEAFSRDEFQLSPVLPMVELEKTSNLSKVLQAKLYHETTQQFLFKEAFIREFLASIATFQIVMLSGPSGVGKSALSQYFAKLFNFETVTCSVESYWNRFDSLIGFANMLMPKTTDAQDNWMHTAFSKKMISGEVRKDVLQLLILEECNLARIEHYLAELLSALQQEERPIKIPLKGDYLNRDLIIDQNFKIIGTMNIDETTHQLSPKVIDRIGFMKFENPLLIVEQEQIDIPSKDHCHLIQANTSLFFSEPQEIVKLLEDDSSFLNLKEEVMTSLRNINLKYLKVFGNDVSFGPRVLKQCERLIALLYWLGSKTYEELLDSVFRIKILPRFNFQMNDTNQSKYEELINHLKSKMIKSSQILEQMKSKNNRTSLINYMKY
jgi:hypothetical protein